MEVKKSSIPETPNLLTDATEAPILFFPAAGTKGAGINFFIVLGGAVSRVGKEG